jgi:integrase
LFTPEELELLMSRENRYNILEIRDRVLSSLLIYQGLKSQEICELNLQNIDLDNGTIKIKATKTSSSRILELHRKQILLLNTYIYQDREKLYTGSSNRLLITHRGETFKVNTITVFLKPLKHLFSDRNLNAKTIRQSVIANWLNMKKYPLGDVQIMAGHKYPSSTERYLAKDPNDQRKMINQFHPLS